jgi:hypothetical protein
MLTREQCQKILFNVGIKLGVAPKLIATRLLSTDDKEDMLNGLISEPVLECHVKAWIDSGMCNRVDGSNLPYRKSLDLPMQRYRGVGESV